MQSNLESGTQVEEAPPKSEKPYAPPQDFLSGQREMVKGSPRPSSTVWNLVLVIGDVALLAIVFALLFFFHILPGISMAPRLADGEVKLIWICLALVSWVLAVNMAQSQSLNYASNRFKGPCCTIFALVLMCIFWVLFSYYLIGLNVLASVRLELYFLGLAAPLFTIWRFLFAEVTHLPRYRLRAVIVGANPAGETVAKELLSSRSSSTSILGYISVTADEKTYDDTLPILGDKDTLRYMAYHQMIDMIVVAFEYGTNAELFKVATDAAQLGISVVPMAVVYENSTGKIPVEYVGDQWYAALQSERILSPLYLFWKKGFDLLCGFFGLLLLAVVFPFVALCIRLDSPGPIFYSQERVGLRGKPFRIYKFRTMRSDAERGGKAQWATNSDSRVTRVGRFLRSTHLDEVPQLYNILRGDMSMIGPRPERAIFISELEKTIPFYGRRHSVKPGLTGWAQVKYRYAMSNNDALIKLQYDLYYVKRQSFMLDLFIIVLTVVEVLTLRGV